MSTETVVPEEIGEALPGGRWLTVTGAVLVAVGTVAIAALGVVLGGLLWLGWPGTAAWTLGLLVG
ncbi:hypothetical protein [Natronorarus salvus]|uniref:hypothetical protein n=1 Tax=Natronorarus salvus TaxID=3117733 RepID=UPI002F264D7F